MQSMKEGGKPTYADHYTIEPLRIQITIFIYIISGIISKTQVLLNPPVARARAPISNSGQNV